MGRLQDLYISRMVAYLAREGERIANDALFSKQTQNDTMNQADAYGYAVFYNGALKKNGYAASEMSGQEHRGWDKYGIPAGTGREWAAMLVSELGSNNKIPQTGFALVIFNAAFYSNIQEAGKWQILSQVVWDIKELQAKFKDSTITPIGNITIG